MTSPVVWECLQGEGTRSAPLAGALFLCIGAPAGQGSYAPQERGVAGGFGATKMRFGEGEERAARVSYGLPASS
jgi:hypothetical protein